jgi:hypothetical protein
MVELLVAQALVEHGMLDSVASGFARLRYELEGYVGQGRSGYVLLGALILMLWLVSRGRR